MSKSVHDEFVSFNILGGEGGGYMFSFVSFVQLLWIEFIYKNILVTYLVGEQPGHWHRVFIRNDSPHSQSKNLSYNPLGQN